MPMTPQQAELWSRLREFDIDRASPDDPVPEFPFVDRLAAENGWTRTRAARVIEEYRRFVLMMAVSPDPISPSDAVDQAWHLHITYTRSYWERMCRAVVGRPLHHSPTKGGRAEAAKFAGWYRRTLEQYRQLFDEEPPTDIWPTAEEHDRGEAPHRRVDLDANWVVSKRAVREAAKTAAVVVVSAGIATLTAGCVVAAASTASNPLDMRGPDFLGFYVQFFVLGVIVATVLRWKLRRPNDEPRPEDMKLAPYEAAYLVGKEEGAVNTAVVLLAQKGYLKADPETPGRLIPAESADAQFQKPPAHPLERAVLDIIRGNPAGTGATMGELRGVVKRETEMVADRLTDAGLLQDRQTAKLSRWVPLLVALGIPALGLAKVWVGMLRDRPVGDLIILLFITTIVALIAFARRTFRSRRGDRVLWKLKTEWGPRRNPDPAQAGPELAMLVGLFGVSMLAGTAFADMQRTLTPPPGSGADGSSGCGGGCGGDGGGGGGCGGCGGD